MTTLTHSQLGYAAPSATRPAGQVKKGAGFSAKDFFSLLQQSFAMTRAIPDAGRVSAKDVAKVRAMLVDAK